jgi:hypothetical protein
VFDERDEDPTRPGAAGGGGAETTVSNLALAFLSIAHHLSETARLLGAVGGSERAFALRRIAAELGELGDLSHDARRALWSLAEQQR